MSQLNFQHIEYFFLIALPVIIAGVFIYALYKKKVILRKLGDKNLVKLLTADHKPSAYLINFLLSSLAVIFLIIALANPRSALGSQQVTRNGIDVMIALDVSKSMLAQDIKPTRLDRAKQFLSRLVDKLDNDRVGIVIFAGRAYLQMPLTGDHSSAKMYLNATTTESVPTQGTVIGDALKMCAASFNAKEKKYKAVVLISDGEDHDEGAIQVASAMAQDGMVIYTVGIGSIEGSPLIDEATNQLKTDKDGNTVISKLNETELQLIAAKGNGKYAFFKTTESLADNLVEELERLDQRTVTDDSLINYTSYAPYFLIAALLILMLQLFISERASKNKLRTSLKVASIFLFMLINLGSYAQEENKIIKDGNDKYKKGDYPAASDRYGNAVQQGPDNGIGQFNFGNALYKSGKKEEAILAYDRSIKIFDKREEKSNAYYNKGVVLQNDQKLPECIDAYKKALILAPDNEDARQNLQKALQKQKEQQQKQNEKDNKKPNQKKEKDKKEPKPQPSKLTKQDAADKLNALMQQEKALQDKLHKVNAASVTMPEKDW